MTMHYKFQQSSPIYSGWCLRFRSSTECWLLQLLHRDRAHSANCSDDLSFHGAVPGRCRHARWCANDTAMVLTVQKHRDSSVAVHWQGDRCWVCWSCSPRCFRGGDSRAPTIAVVELWTKSLTCPSLCNDRVFYSGGASDTVHRLFMWTFQLCNTDGYDVSSNLAYGGDDGFFDAFCVIFRAPPAMPELSASFSSPR